MSVEFKQWAVVELFGHQQIAGFVTEQEIAGTSFVRVDVPGLDGAEGLSKLYGPAAIYCITPVSEEVAVAVVENLRPRPLNVWVPDLQRKLPPPTVEPDDRPEPDEIEF